MPMKFRWWMGVLILMSLGFSIACSTSNITSSTTIADLLFTSQGDMSVLSYQVNLSTGALTQVGSEVTTGANTMPVSIKITPDGKAAFVVNRGVPPSGTDSIATYTVNGDGSVSSSGANVASGGPGPIAAAIDGSGKFLFVANQGVGGISGTSSISVYTISGATVTLASTTPTDDFASALVVSQTSNFLYVTNSIGGPPLNLGEVTQYSFDSTTGALTKVNSYITGGTTPSGVAINRKGYLYVTNFGSNNISGFVIASDGTLSPATKSPYSIASGTGPQTLVADPVEDFLYVCNYGSNQVSGFLISAASGALTALTPNATSTGAGPSGIAMDPTGVYVYTTNVSGASLSAYHVDFMTGALGPIQSAFVTPGQPSAIAIH
jgi:6-phosphogluconolactonase (cycloisomerase 2 family)